MVVVRVASHRINVFLLGASECAVVLGVLTHPHVLPEVHAPKNICTDKATNFSLLVLCGFEVSNELERGLMCWG